MSSIYFVVSANVEVGLGHLSRCWSLAEYLRFFDCRIKFIFIESDKKIVADFLLGKSVDCEFCTWDIFFEKLEAPGFFYQKTVVIDIYDFDPRLNNYPKKENNILVQFLDYSNQAIVPGAQTISYLGVGADIDGFEYFPLNYRLRLFEHRQKNQGYKHVGIYLGAGVAETLYSRLIDALGVGSENWKENIKFEILVPSPLRKFESSIVGLDVRETSQAVDIFEFYSRCDLVVGASGVSAIERAILGIPSLNFITTQNQILVARAIRREFGVDAINFMDNPLWDHLVSERFKLMLESLETDSPGICFGDVSSGVYRSGGFLLSSHIAQRLPVGRVSLVEKCYFIDDRESCESLIKFHFFDVLLGVIKVRLGSDTLDFVKGEEGSRYERILHRDFLVEKVLAGPLVVGGVDKKSGYHLVFIVRKDEILLKKLSEFILNHLGYRISVCFDQTDIPVSADYAYVIGFTRVLDPNIFAKYSGVFLVHESDLPKGKGFAPLFWQIIEGNSKIVFSLIRLEAAVDSGDIVMQELVQIDEWLLHDEIRDLQYSKTFEMIGKALQSKAIMRTGRPQKQEGEFFYPRRTVESGYVDPQISIEAAFPLLRTSSWREYPVHFVLGGVKYQIRIDRSD